MKANTNNHRLLASHDKVFAPQNRTVANILNNGINNGDSFFPRLYTALANFPVAFAPVFIVFHAQKLKVVIVPDIPIITPPRAILFSFTNRLNPSSLD